VKWRTGQPTTQGDAEMIWDSGPWKESLTKDAQKLIGLVKKSEKKKNHDDVITGLERIVFLTAFVMRKLFDDKKLSNSWTKNAIEVKQHRLVGYMPDHLNWHRVHEHYDLKKSEMVKVAPDEFCSRIIHSFIFIPVFNARGILDGYYLSSDKTRKTILWFVDLQKYIEILDRTAQDTFGKKMMIRRKDGDFSIWIGDGDPPPGWVEAAESWTKKPSRPKK
jgi:hypothetical protein